jgi:hypothetical protein
MDLAIDTYYGHFTQFIRHLHLIKKQSNLNNVYQKPKSIRIKKPLKVFYLSIPKITTLLK